MQIFIYCIFISGVKFQFFSIQPRRPTGKNISLSRWDLGTDLYGFSLRRELLFGHVFAIFRVIVYLISRHCIGKHTIQVTDHFFAIVDAFHILNYKKLAILIRNAQFFNAIIKIDIEVLFQFCILRYSVLCCTYCAVARSFLVLNSCRRSIA